VDGVEAVVRLSTPGFTSPSPICGVGGDAGGSLGALLDSFGTTALPPYLRRAATPDDVDSYQAVYASPQRAGSVATPTAGLHFTPELLAALTAAGVRTSKVALHAGAATFKPVTAANAAEHSMHSEAFSIGTDALEAIAQSVAEGRPIVPVGTTSARLLESLCALGGARSEGQPTLTSSWIGHLGQWDAYSSPREPAHALASLQQLADAARAGGHERLHGSTSLCIAPGYQFGLCDGLITNFHAPDSTLLLLVGALLGGAAPLQSLYKHALQDKYRFLSYGDACYIVRPPRGCL